MNNNLLKLYPTLKKEALVLPSEYDHCILYVQNGVLVYCKDLVINVLIKENIAAINKGIIDRDLDYENIEQQSYFLALEMFDYNLDCNLKNGPLFKDKDSDD